MTKKDSVAFLDVFNTFAKNMSLPQVSPDMFPSFDPMPGMTAADPFGLVGKSQDQLAALMKANETTAEIFREHALRQSQIFNTLMEAAREHAGELETSLDAESQEKNLQMYGKAYETAVDLMRQLADETREASEAAFQKIAAQAQESIKEFSTNEKT